MQPINRSERSRAYLNFMLLFLLCTVIVATTVFFSTRASVKNNEQLVKYKTNMGEKEDLKKEFALKLESVSDKIDSLSKISEADYLLYKTKIGLEIDNLNKLISKTDNIDAILYPNVMENLTRYLAAKIEAKEKNLDNSGQEKKQSEIDDLKKEKDKYKDALWDCEHPKNKPSN